MKLAQGPHLCLLPLLQSIEGIFTFQSQLAFHYLFFELLDADVVLDGDRWAGWMMGRMDDGGHHLRDRHRQTQTQTQTHEHFLVETSWFAAAVSQ